MDIIAELLLWNMPFLLNPNYQINYKKKQLKNMSDRHIQTSRISIWISTMVTKRLTLNISSLVIHTAVHDGSHE